MPSGSSATSTTGQATGPLLGLDPCGLITVAEANELGAPGRGEPDTLATSRGCGWTVPGSHVFGVAFFDTMGIADLTLSGRRSSVTIEGRPAERVEGDSLGGCVVIFPITDSSVAEAGVQARSDTAKACAIAEQVARLIAPKLP